MDAAGDWLTLLGRDHKKLDEERRRSKDRVGASTSAELVKELERCEIV
jgi:hypothetical protein